MELLHSEEADYPESVPHPDLDSARYQESVYRDELPRRVLPYVDGRCIHLTADNRCGIYERRPTLCRRFNCLDGYGYKPGSRHSFFLDDNPEVTELIERVYPDWVEMIKKNAS